jgi:hypothetical protein
VGIQGSDPDFDLLAGAGEGELVAIHGIDASQDELRLVPM